MAAIITKIRAGNQFEYIWAIERAGVAVDLTTATDIELSYGVGKPCTDYSKIPFTVVDANKISSSHLYGVTGTYNLKLEFKIDGEQSTIDIDAFKIVPRSEDASDSSQFVVTSDMAIGFKGDKGDKLTFADLTTSDIAELQQPANDAIVSIQAVEVSVEQAEALRVQAEIDRQTNTGTAIQNANTAIQNAQTATTNAQTATTNAQTATTNANNAATLANTKAGLADTAATNANNKAGLADTAATNANNVANGYAAELALKELKANKQNSLTTDGTGTKFPTVDAVNGGLALKANKVQEEWITPTLLNGWVAFGQELATAQYFKDNIGMVHLRGIVKGGTVYVVFNLPVGYRPSATVYIPTVSNGVFGYLTIGDDGIVCAVSYSSEWVSLENITFRAEK